MKQVITSLFIAGLVFAGTAVNAQDKQPAKVPTKGYYSIKQNADRLPQNQANKISAEKPNVKKGFYTIERNKQQLPARTTTVVIGPISPVTKGYYSIPKVGSF